MNDELTLNQTPPPTPNWDRHIEGAVTVKIGRDLGDEQDDADEQEAEWLSRMPR